MPAELKLNLSRCLNTARFDFLNFSNNLKSMVDNHNDIRDQLFLNNESALYYSGDILAKTLHDYWIKGGCIKEIFIENAQAAAFYAGFECIW